MLGLVHSLFGDFVTEELGLDVWQATLDNSKLVSNGIFVSSDFYADADLVALLRTVSAHTQRPLADLLSHFGRFLYPHLTNTAIGKRTKSLDFWDFLKEVPKTTHFKARQSMPNAAPPAFTLIGEEPTMTLIYASERKLCFLAEGLIYAAAADKCVSVSIKHKSCMHRGDSDCQLEICADD
jgi:hypothetical protein